MQTYPPRDAAVWTLFDASLGVDLPLAQVAGLFTTPGLAAAGAALVTIPILIHLLFRLRRKRVDWAAMRFLLEAFKKQRRRLKLEQWLLLAVRCLLVALIGAALAGPLLSGCSEMLRGGGQGGRVVHIVLDDALSMGMVEVGEATRLDRLKAQARSVIEAADPADEIVLWRAGEAIERIAVEAGPGGGGGEENGDLRVRLLERLDTIEPRFGRSAVAGVLERVAGELEASGSDPSRSHVVVLSDFSRGTTWLDRPPAAVLEGLGERAQVTVSAPASASANVQLSTLSADRSVVVTDGLSRAVVSLRGQVRRSGGASSLQPLRLTVEVLDAAGGVLAQLQRPVVMEPGQATVPVNVDVTLPADALTMNLGEGASASDQPNQGRELAVRAVLTSAQPDLALDGLAADDQRLAVVRLRNRLTVGLVEDVTGRGGPLGDGGVGGGGGLDLRPGQWLAAALAPGRGVEGFAVSVVPPSVVSAEAVSELDAVMVLRPDLVSAPGWGALHDYLRAGGVVWVMPPPQLEDDLAWTRPMAQRLGLSWTWGDSVVTLATPRSLDADQPAPPTLQLLAANWPGLLRPVTVSRYLAVQAPDAKTWLTLERQGTDTTEALAQASGDDDVSGRALMVVERVERGVLVYLGTAVDPNWTTLPVKPLLTSLMQDAMRGLLGTTAQFASASSGEVLALSGLEWGTRLRRLAGVEVTSDGGDAVLAARDVEAVASEGGSFMSSRPMVWPGLWAGEGGLRVAVVNVVAEAGDTGEVAEGKLSGWLNVLGPTTTLGPQVEGEEVLTVTAGATNLGWLLLWAVLGLVVIESLMARRFSHAATGEGAGVARRVMGHLRGRAA